MMFPANSEVSTRSRLTSYTRKANSPRASPSDSMIVSRLTTTSSLRLSPSRTPPRFEMAMKFTSPGRSKSFWRVASRVTRPPVASKSPTPVRTVSSTISTTVNSCGWPWTNTCTRSPGSAANSPAALLFMNASSAAKEAISTTLPVVVETASGKSSSECASGPTKFTDGSLRRVRGLKIGTSSSSTGRKPSMFGSSAVVMAARSRLVISGGIEESISSGALSSSPRSWTHSSIWPRKL